MTAEILSLAIRIRASSRFRWMPGMLIHAPGVVSLGGYRVMIGGTDPWCISHHDGRGAYATDDGWLPDPSDPATVGCLLALLRAVEPVELDDIVAAMEAP